MKDWGDDKDSRWINGLYYSVSAYPDIFEVEIFVICLTSH